MRAEKPPSQSVFLTVSTMTPPGRQMRISSSSPSTPTWPEVKTPAETMPAKWPSAKGSGPPSARRVKGLVGAFLGGLGEHAFGNVERLDMRIAHDAKPLADQAGAGAGVEQGRSAARQMARKQRQADRRMTVAGDRHLVVVGLATSGRRGPRPRRRPSLRRPRRARRHACRLPSLSCRSRCVSWHHSQGTKTVERSRQQKRREVGAIHERRSGTGAQGDRRRALPEGLRRADRQAGRADQSGLPGRRPLHPRARQGHRGIHQPRQRGGRGARGGEGRRQPRSALFRREGRDGDALRRRRADHVAGGLQAERRSAGARRRGIPQAAHIRRGLPVPLLSVLDDRRLSEDPLDQGRRAAQGLSRRAARGRGDPHRAVAASREARRLPLRSALREFPRHRRAHVDRRLGIFGDERPDVGPRRPLGRRQVRRAPGRGDDARLFLRRAEAGRARARRDLQGDVRSLVDALGADPARQQQPGGGFPRICRRALRSAAAS